jgi:hypothetical protein
MHSGMFSDNGEFDEDKGIQILAELDKLPLIEIDVYEITFTSYGTLIEINEKNLTVFSKHSEKNETFIYDKTSDLKEGEKVKVYYNYFPEGEKKVLKVEMYSPKY